MSILSVFNFIGLIYPLVFIATGIAFNLEFNPSWNIELAQIVEWAKWSLIPVVFNLLINSATFSNGKRKYGPFDMLMFRTDKYLYPQESIPHSDKYPELDITLKANRPIGAGMVIGKLKSDYVINNLYAGGSHNTIIAGETGCGKTSTIVLDTVIGNMDAAALNMLPHNRTIPQSQGLTNMVIDIKGEISVKGSIKDAKNVRIVDPLDWGTYGYDPFYMLSDNSKEQDIINCLKTVCFSLLPINPKSGDKAFWDANGRDMLLSFMLYLYKSGVHQFIDIIDAIVEHEPAALIEEIASNSADNSPERKLIAKFINIAPETLASVALSMQTDLNIFITDSDIRHMLNGTVNTASPQDLNKRISVYYVIPEERLDDYATVLHLIINQAIIEMEKRGEHSTPVLMIIDELARILSTGKIEKLMNGLETLRSRNVTLMLITQSFDALQRAYSHDEVQALISNCPYKVILSASSKETQDMVIRWAGKARIKKYSHGKSGSRYSENTGTEEKNIVEASDLIKLPTTGEAILISPYGYNRIKKVPYYKDKYLKSLAEAIKKYNALIDTIRAETKGV